MADMYERLVRPLLFNIPSETIHHQTLAALDVAQRSSFGRNSLTQLRGDIPSQPVELFGLTFPNIIGVAAGFDKDARVASGLATLGFGHVEVGTLTPWPQRGNPKPRIFRLTEDAALINRMGFPNGGVVAALPRLRALAEAPREWVLGVSLGKQKETPLDQAADDYLSVMTKVAPYADYLAVNVSSPNTPGLRALQGGDYLGHLLRTLTVANRAQFGKPLLVKIAPDMGWAEIDAIVDACHATQVDGIIATNTTISRAGLSSSHAAEKGGLSGQPLRQRSNEVIAHLAQQTDLPIIGVGGVQTADDVRAKLDAGAKLVQIYTGLVYAGPTLAGRILRQLDA